MQEVFGINWNEVVFNGAAWIGTILLLGLIWIVGSIPAAIMGWLKRKGKQVPKLLDDHIVLVEIVWIALLCFIAWRLGI